MLLKAAEELEPTFVGVAMDAKGPTFRHEEFAAYKEHRPQMDKDLETQVGKTHQLLKVLGVPSYLVEGYEGEDLIASLAKQVGKKVDEVVIVSGDRDLFQLVGGKVHLFVPEKGLSGGKLYGTKAVVEKLGIKPEQVVDFKALCGDPSDNIPGVRGIGGKTATKLLGKYGSLEEIYRHLSELPEKTKKLLKEGEKEAKLSQKIATIVADAPVKLELKEWDKDLVKKKKVRELFQKLGFKSLLREEENERKDQLKLI